MAGPGDGAGCLRRHVRVSGLGLHVGSALPRGSTGSHSQRIVSASASERATKYRPCCSPRCPPSSSCAASSQLRLVAVPSLLAAARTPAMTERSCSSVSRSSPSRQQSACIRPAASMPALPPAPSSRSARKSEPRCSLLSELRAGVGRGSSLPRLGTNSSSIVTFFKRRSPSHSRSKKLRETASCGEERELGEGRGWRLDTRWGLRSAAAFLLRPWKRRPSVQLEL